MKKIGKQVCLLTTDSQIHRCGEGAFIRLKDGRIMYAYTEYVGVGCDDFDPARISAVFSGDEGDSWGNKRVLMEPRPCDRNVMSVSLMRMKNGELGMFFLRKTGDFCVLNLVRSADEGETWSEPVICLDDQYWIVCNDRIIRLKNGDLLCPANLHPYPDAPSGVQYYFRSSDDGQTWKQLCEPLSHPFPNSMSGLTEGGVYEFENGDIWGFARTRSGSQYMMYSKDGGESWTPPCGSELFTSPAAPMQVKDAGPYTVAVFNPKAQYYGRLEIEPNETGKRLWSRTPFACLVSKDGGQTFPMGFLLEDDPANSACYPAILGCEDYFLVGYYYSNGDDHCLTGGKILKVMLSELEDGYQTTAKVAQSHALQNGMRK